MLRLWFIPSIVVCVEWVLPIENWYSTTRGETSTPTIYGLQAEITTSWGMEEFLASNTTHFPITPIYYDNEFSVSVCIRALSILYVLTIKQIALSYLIDYSGAGNSLIGGNPLSGVLSATGQAGSVYGVAQMSAVSSSAIFSNKFLYPLVSRCTASALLHAQAGVDTILSFIDMYGIGWNKVALMITTESYGISLGNSFIEASKETTIELLAYQQYLIDSTDLSIELGEILKSGAKIVVCYAVSGFPEVLRQSKEIGLLDDNHVFLVGPLTSASTFVYTFPNGTIDNDTATLLQGTLGSQVFVPRTGYLYDSLISQWEALDPVEVPGAGPGSFPPTYTMQNFDMGITLAQAILQAEGEGYTPDNSPSAEQWTKYIRSQTFIGSSGVVEYDKNGDRQVPISIINFNQQELRWVEVGIWNYRNGTTFNESHPIVWHDNTTAIPDLDIRPPFDYWSCSKKKQQEDKTGKTIVLHSPDSSSVDEIDIDYHCDHFIDCKNLSDESYDCTANYTILFIVFGVVTSIMILGTLCLLPMVIIFGFIIKRSRVRAASPVFLILIILSSVVGFISTFSWYGKPHPVACGFRPWLLGLSVLSMVSALSAKTWRIWRIFKATYIKTVIRVDRLIILYIIMIIPAIVILVIWTIVSTPTAKMVDRNGEPHYICASGGFTGDPGGFIFFFLLVAYEGVVLLFGAFLSIVTRNIPSFFNESKLVAISIYNLGFLAVIVIPVFLVLEVYNPFAAWIIRTVAILYAFSATLVLQFCPMIFGIIFVDKLQNKENILTLQSESDTNQFQ